MNPEIINDGQSVKRKRSGGGRAFHNRWNRSWASFASNARSAAHGRKSQGGKSANKPDKSVSICRLCDMMV
jgi:hypothetical protein